MKALLGVMMISSVTAMAQMTLPLDRNAWLTTGWKAPRVFQSEGGVALNVPIHRATRLSTVNYLLTSVNRPITGSAMSVTLKVATSGDPVFNYQFESGNTCLTPATVRPYIERVNWEYGGEFFRWWSNPVAYKLGQGTITLTVPLSPESWSSVYGKLGSFSPEARQGFYDALQNMGRMGLSFGGGCFFGHGVNVSNGEATFTLLNYSTW
jgi:hypothetical protein